MGFARTCSVALLGVEGVVVGTIDGESVRVNAALRSTRRRHVRQLDSV